MNNPDNRAKRLVILAFPLGVIIFFGVMLVVMLVLWDPILQSVGGEPTGLNIAALLFGIGAAAATLLVCFVLFALYLDRSHGLPKTAALGLLIGPAIALIIFVLSGCFLGAMGSALALTLFDATNRALFGAVLTLQALLSLVLTAVVGRQMVNSGPLFGSDETPE